MSEDKELYLNFDEYIRQGEPAQREPESTPSSTPSSLGQVQDKLHTDNVLIIRLIRVIGHEQLSIKQMLEGVGLKDRMNFIEYNLNPAIAEGYVRLLYPQSPRHPRQKYLLTVKGLALYNEINARSNDRQD